jgi:hypothetical protein
MTVGHSVPRRDRGIEPDDAAVVTRSRAQPVARQQLNPYPGVLGRATTGGDRGPATAKRSEPKEDKPA